MSDGPAKRRRIAGEGRPGGNPGQAASRKVVRKPVTRPGTTPPAGGTPPREPAEVGTPDATHVDETAEETTALAPEVDAPETDAADGDDVLDGPDAVDQPDHTDHTDVVDDRDDADPAVDGTDDGASSRRPPRVAALRGRRTAGPATTDADVETDAGDTRPDEEPVVEPAPRSRRRTVVTLLAVAAIAFGVVGGAFGVVDWRQGQGVSTAHADAAETAAASAETIFTYQYDRLDQYLEDSQDVMTASFAQEFETISPALQDLAPQREIQVQATTRDAAALPCGDDCETDRARVLIFVDQARIADGAERPTVFGNRVEMTMVERDGRWLVDDIKAL